MTYAKMIEDSVSPEGVRLTTMEVRFHRFVLAEFNTHRCFSRNSASSRAIPVHKQLDRLKKEPAYPLQWPKEQKGMQGGNSFSTADQLVAKAEWGKARDDAITHAEKLIGMKLHKSLVNRLLEPFMWHTVVVTSTAWDNFFEQRCSPLAQPEIQAAAALMREVYEWNKPTELHPGEYHLPYWDTTKDDLPMGYSHEESWQTIAKISAARCARVSYLTHDGQRDYQADLDLYDKLVSAKPAHWSPLEHVATPWAENRQIPKYVSPLWWSDGKETYKFYTEHLPRVGNFPGWRQLRAEEEVRQGLLTYA